MFVLKYCESIDNPNNKGYSDDLLVVKVIQDALKSIW